MAFCLFELVDGNATSEAGGFDCEDLTEAKDIAPGLAIKLASDQQHLIGKGVTVVAR